MKKEEAKNNAADFKSAFESAPGLFLMLKPNAPDFTILDASDLYLKATKTKREEITGRNLFDVFPENPHDPKSKGTQNLKHSLQYVIQNKQPHNMVIQKYDIPRPASEGGGFEERYWSPLNVPVLDDEKEVRFIIHSVKDVTELALYKKESLEEIKQARVELERKSALIAENQERISTILNTLLKYTTLDFSEQMAISERADEIDAIAVGLNSLGEELETHINLLREEEAKLSKLNAELEKKVEERTRDLAFSEQRFRALIEYNSDAIVLGDAQGKPLYQSPSATRLLGWTLEDRKNIPGFNFIHEEDVDKIRKIFAEAMAEPGKPFAVTFRMKHKQGHYIWVDGFITNHLNNPAIGAVVANYRDITDKKRVEEQQKLLSAIVNYSDDGILSKKLDGTITSWNRGAEKIFGYKQEEMIGKNIRTLIPKDIVGEEDEIVARIKKGENIDHFETVRRRKDGTEMYVSITVSPLRDEKGIIVGASKIIRDITEQKKAQREIKKLNETLEQKVIERTDQLQKVNKELEAFSYSVSHDLRAPLRAIDGYARIIEEDYIKLFDEEGKRLFGVIQYNARKMGTLIDDLLAFSRLGRKELNKMSVNMNELVEGAILEIEKSTPHKAKIKIGKLGSAEVDYGLISQVMVNLLSNAIKYSSKNPNPKIEINAEEKENEVIYSIKDNGVGFDMKYAGKLFGVFQRLHSEEDFPGTGVGLAIVQRVVNKHGGRIWADAKPDEGATFYFSLPKGERSK